MKTYLRKFQTRANIIAKKVQNKINKNGAYENAGQYEIRKFMDKVQATCIPYKDQCDLQDYINNLINNLEY